MGDLEYSPDAPQPADRVQRYTRVQFHQAGLEQGEGRHVLSCDEQAIIAWTVAVDKADRI